MRPTGWNLCPCTYQTAPVPWPASAALISKAVGNASSENVTETQWNLQAVLWCKGFTKTSLIKYSNNKSSHVDAQMPASGLQSFSILHKFLCVCKSDFLSAQVAELLREWAEHQAVPSLSICLFYFTPHPLISESNPADVSLSSVKLPASTTCSQSAPPAPCPLQWIRDIGGKIC